MSNSTLILAILSGVGCLLASGMPVRAADTSPALASPALALPALTSSESGSARQVELRPAPVPLVRKVTATSGRPVAAVEPIRKPDATEPPSESALASGAAKAAVEADGYKRVTVVGRGPNGTWRVTGHRGDNEVLLTVDQAGSVFTE